MVFCNKYTQKIQKHQNSVTILILIDGFLQLVLIYINKGGNYGHNPYFNRWFSAMSVNFYRQKNIYGHNPYFNRWFSAIDIYEVL